MFAYHATVDCALTWKFGTQYITVQYHYEHIPLSRHIFTINDLQYVTQRWQDASTIYADVHVLFEAKIGKYPAFRSRLSQIPGIILHGAFEDSVVKLQDNTTPKLKLKEAGSVSILRVTTISNISLSPTFVSCINTEGTHIGLQWHVFDLPRCRFIVPTSTVCERLMSTASLAWGNRLERLVPLHLEQQIFVNVNDIYLAFRDVSKIVAKQQGSVD